MQITTLSQAGCWPEDDWRDWYRYSHVNMDEWIHRYTMEGVRYLLMVRLRNWSGFSPLTSAWSLVRNQSFRKLYRLCE